LATGLLPTNPRDRLKRGTSRRTQRWRGVRDVLRFCSIISVGICLVPAGAHLFELPNKIGLAPADYMIVQRIYAGWWLFAIPIFMALVLTAVNTIVVRSNRTAFWFSLSAFVCLAATQAIFWTFTYPMNAASSSWTVMPEPFETVRFQWEYSHAVNAGLTFVALSAITLAVLADKHDGGRRASE